MGLRKDIKVVSAVVAYDYPSRMLQRRPELAMIEVIPRMGLRKDIKVVSAVVAYDYPSRMLQRRPELAMIEVMVSNNDDSKIEIGQQGMKHLILGQDGS